MLVRLIEGEWVPWTDRNENLERVVEPFDSHTLSAAVLDRNYSDEELAEYGLKRVVLAEIPADKEAIGDPTYDEDENGVVHQVYVLVDKPGPGSEQVNAERERRIVSGANFTVSGVAEPIHVTGRDEDKVNLQALAFAASLRLGQGDNATITVFRDGQNVDHSLIPAQVLELWQHAAAYVTLIYQRSWEIKALAPIPADYADDSYWSEA